MVKALLVLTLVAAATAHAGEPARVFVWEVPRPIEAVDVPDRVEAGGVPVAIHAVRSRESAETLEVYFKKEFAKRGLFVPPPEHLPLGSAHRQVTGLDPDTFIAYTIFLQENADGTTTALITETFLAERRKQGEVDFAPVMPGAKGVVQSRTEGLQVVSYRVAATVDEAWQFHESVLAEASFEQTSPGVFERGGMALQVVVLPGAAGEVSVSVMERSAGAAAREFGPVAEDAPAP